MPDRAALRIADLKRRARTPTQVMNMRVPVPILDAIDKLARELCRSKTEVVVALLNSGMGALAKKR